MIDFAAIAARFESRRRLAELLGVSRNRVDKWCERGAAAAEMHVAIVTAAAVDGVEVSHEELAACHASAAERRRAGRTEAAA